MKICFLGTGVYSLAIALSLTEKADDITLWSEDYNKVEELKNTQKLESVIPNITIPSNIKITNDYMTAVKDAKYIFIGSTNKYVKSIAKSIKEFYNPQVPIIILTKGLNEIDKEFLSTTIENVLHTEQIAIISGPTFAADIIKKTPAALTVASKSLSLSLEIKHLWENTFINIERSLDIIGTQICGGYKNIIAIACGMVAGLELSESTRAYLLTIALKELKELLILFEVDSNTVTTYAGIGDLILTCTSTQSRNYEYGKILVTNYQEAQKYLENNTVEGYSTLLTFNEILKEKNMKNNLIYIINDIVLQKEEPLSLINYLKKK